MRWNLGYVGTSRIKTELKWRTQEVLEQEMNTAAVFLHLINMCWGKSPFLMLFLIVFRVVRLWAWRPSQVSLSALVTQRNETFYRDYEDRHAATCFTCWAWELTTTVVWLAASPCCTAVKLTDVKHPESTSACGVCRVQQASKHVQETLKSSKLLNILCMPTAVIRWSLCFMSND